MFFAVFGLLYAAVERQDQVKQMKREHPTLVMMATFLSGHFLIYQVESLGSTKPLIIIDLI